MGECEESHGDEGESHGRSGSRLCDFFFSTEVEDEGGGREERERGGEDTRQRGRVFIVEGGWHSRRRHRMPGPRIRSISQMSGGLSRDRVRNLSPEPRHDDSTHQPRLKTLEETVSRSGNAVKCTDTSSTSRSNRSANDWSMTTLGFDSRLGCRSSLISSDAPLNTIIVP